MTEAQIRITVNERGVRKVIIPVGTAAKQGKAALLAVAVLKNLRAVNSALLEARPRE